MPPPGIELGIDAYKATVIPFNYRGKTGGPQENRTLTSAVQRRRAPIITSSPKNLFSNHIETHLR